MVKGQPADPEIGCCRLYSAGRSGSWLDRFLGLVRPSGALLDLGCGMGEPIARYCMESGFQVVGIDSSPSLIALCRTRFPHAEWFVRDMRELELDRRFDGILAWDSFFHLSADDQRRMFPVFARHAQNGAPLMFASGTSEGEAIGCQWFLGAEIRSE